MIQYIKSVTIIFFAGLIVFASGGINLYQQYCTCTDYSNVSIITDDISNNFEDEGHCCNSKIYTSQTESCCKNVVPKSTEKECCNSSSDNCCEEIYTFLKTDHYHISQQFKKSIRFIVLFVAIFKNETIQSKSIKTDDIDYFNDLPPPLFGKHLLCSLHKLKLVPPLA